MIPDERRPTCPSCGQLLTAYRLGVRLGPLRARLFDCIKRAGPDGIAAADLFELIFASRNVGRQALKAHVWAINMLLQDTDWKIGSNRGRAYCRYWIERRTMKRGHHGPDHAHARPRQGQKIPRTRRSASIGDDMANSANR